MAGELVKTPVKYKIAPSIPTSIVICKLKNPKNLYIALKTVFMTLEIRPNTSLFLTKIKTYPLNLSK